MAKMRVSAGIIEQHLFGERCDHDVQIISCEWDAIRQQVILTIEGEDVPECEEVIGVITQNPRAETMVFQPVKTNG